MQFKDLISKRTRQLLKERNWTQYRLATRGAIPFSTLSYILNDKGHSLSSETIINLCRGFDMSPGEFFGTDLFDLSNISDD